MGTVITIVLVLFLAFMGLGAYATVKVVRAAKRGVDRTLDQARRTVEDTGLRAKTFAQPGPAGELAQLRLQLRTSMRATQDALHARVAEDESLRESLSLFERLSAHGRDLDDELKRLEREPDRRKLASLMPTLSERTRRITESAQSLRWAARDRARRFSDDDLDDLSAQIDMEAGALRHWTTEPDAHPAPGRTTPPQASTPWPEAPAPEGSGAQTWPDQQAAAPQEPEPPAITPPSPRPTFAWQKKRRPENTT